MSSRPAMSENTWTVARVSLELDEDFCTALANCEQAIPPTPPTA